MFDGVIPEKNKKQFLEELELLVEKYSKVDSKSTFKEVPKYKGYKETVNVLCGLPGSGKSFYIKQIKAKKAKSDIIFIDLENETYEVIIGDSEDKTTGKISHKLSKNFLNDISNETGSDLINHPLEIYLDGGLFIKQYDYDVLFDIFCCNEWVDRYRLNLIVFKTPNEICKENVIKRDGKNNFGQLLGETLAIPKQQYYRCEIIEWNNVFKNYKEFLIDITGYEDKEYRETSSERYGFGRRREYGKDYNSIFTEEDYGDLSLKVGEYFPNYVGIITNSELLSVSEFKKDKDHFDPYWDGKYGYYIIDLKKLYQIIMNKKNTL